MCTQPFTVYQSTQIESETKKSRFIGVLLPCETERAAIQQLRLLATQHPQANHLAFAWRIRQPEGFINERLHDAGEPSGTAGRPILAPMQGHELINVMVVVIRYFGGIKLGTGGLTRAYGNAAKQVIEQAHLTPWVEMCELTLNIDYAQLQLLEYQLKQRQGNIIDQTFTDSVTVRFRIPAAAADDLKQQFTGH